jgi:Tfp pilus assembly PilM family ATPase
MDGEGLLTEILLNGDDGHVAGLDEINIPVTQETDFGTEVQHPVMAAFSISINNSTTHDRTIVSLVGFSKLVHDSSSRKYHIIIIG